MLVSLAQRTPVRSGNEKPPLVILNIPVNACMLAHSMTSVGGASKINMVAN